MPLGDRTGPVGTGPRTGRGLGLCSGYAAPGYLNAGYGYGRGAGFGRGGGFRRGMGYGFGRGFGWNYVPAAAPTKEDEKNFLKSEIERLTETVDSLKKQLSQLED
jgi:hypothetical protein